MKKGLVTGTFDPITIGHSDIIERAARLCDELTVGIFNNLSKQSIFTLEQRMEMVKVSVKDIPNVKVISCSGHLASFVLDNGYNMVFRGLRTGSDFNYELPLAQQYAKFYKDKAETVYLMADPKYSYLSSTIVRENFLLGADVEEWVLPQVYELMKKYKNI